MKIPTVTTGVRQANDTLTHVERINGVRTTFGDLAQAVLKAGENLLHGLQEEAATQISALTTTEVAPLVSTAIDALTSDFAPVLASSDIGAFVTSEVAALATAEIAKIAATPSGRIIFK